MVWGGRKHKEATSNSRICRKLRPGWLTVFFPTEHEPNRLPGMVNLPGSPEANALADGEFVASASLTMSGCGRSRNPNEPATTTEKRKQPLLTSPGLAGLQVLTHRAILTTPGSFHETSHPRMQYDCNTLRMVSESLVRQGLRLSAVGPWGVLDGVPRSTKSRGPK